MILILIFVFNIPPPSTFSTPFGHKIIQSDIFFLYFGYKFINYNTLTEKIRLLVKKAKPTYTKNTNNTSMEDIYNETI